MSVPKTIQFWNIHIHIFFLNLVNVVEFQYNLLSIGFPFNFSLKTTFIKLKQETNWKRFVKIPDQYSFGIGWYVHKAKLFQVCKFFGNQSRVYLLAVLAMETVDHLFCN